MAAERPLRPSVRPSDANPPACPPAGLLVKTAVLSGSVYFLHILIRTALESAAEHADLLGGGLPCPLSNCPAREPATVARRKSKALNKYF